MRKFNIAAFGALFFVSFAVYSNALDNKFLWDDDDFFVRNGYTKDWNHLKNIFTENVIAGSGLTSNYYRPVLSLSFLVDYTLWRLEPLGYHIVNVMLHAAVSYLVYILINLVIKSRKISLVSAAIYSVHPAHTEAVAYVTGRADPLSALFGLLSFFLFLRFNEHQGNAKKVFYLSSSLLFFLLGLMSREALMFMPFVIALYLLCFEEKKASLNAAWRIFLKISPYIALLAVYFTVRLTVLNFSNTLNFYNESNLFTENIWFRILTFLSVLPEYYKAIFFPLYLNYEREYPIFTNFLNPIIILSALALAAIGFFMLRSWKKDRAVFFGLAFFFIALFPVSNIIVPVNGIMYEHWLYMPLIGAALVFGCIIKYVYSKIHDYNYYFKILFSLLVVIFIVFLSARTYIRNDDWQDGFTLYSRTIKYSPNSVRLNNNLAMEYDAREDYQQAIDYYKKAASLSEKFAQPYYNMANTYAKIGDYNDAIISYEKAISTDPNFLFTYPRLIQLYNALGMKEDAQRVALAYNFRKRS